MRFVAISYSFDGKNYQSINSKNSPVCDTYFKDQVSMIGSLMQSFAFQKLAGLTSKGLKFTEIGASQITGVVCSDITTVYVPDRFIDLACEDDFDGKFHDQEGRLRTVMCP